MRCMESLNNCACLHLSIHFLKKGTNRRYLGYFFNLWCFHCRYVQQRACFLLFSSVILKGDGCSSFGFFFSSLTAVMLTVNSFTEVFFQLYQLFLFKSFATTFGRCSPSCLLGGLDIQLLYFLWFFIFKRFALCSDIGFILHLSFLNPLKYISLSLPPLIKVKNVFTVNFFLLVKHFFLNHPPKKSSTQLTFFCYKAYVLFSHKMDSASKNKRAKTANSGSIAAARHELLMKRGAYSECVCSHAAELTSLWQWRYAVNAGGWQIIPL